MNTNRRFVYVVLIVILLLVMAVAFMARPARKTAPAASAVSAPSAAPASAEPSAPPVDFTAMLSSPKGDIPSARDILTRPPAERQAYSPSVSHSAVPLTGALPQGNYASAAGRAPLPSVPSGRTSAAGSPRRSGGAAAGYTAPAVSSFGSVSGGGRSYPSSYNGGGLPTSAREEAQARADIFSPFTARMTRREQTALNQKLQNFSAGLERAIASAVLPKSKREQNIEKYLARARGEAAVMDGGVYAAGQRQAGGGTEEVMQQLAAQSKSIVDNVRGSYGDGAAEEAQSIMNDFQSEMAETLNAPGDPEEKNIKAQAVNNKYSQKLQQLNNEQSLNKMAEQLRAQNEEYLQKIGQTYGPQTETAMRPLLEDFANKRMQIWATPQSEEAALAQNLALDEQLRKEQERIVKETAPETSAGNLTTLQNELTKERILEESRKVEAGESFSPVYRESEQVRAQNEAAWKKEGEEIVKGFEALGPEAAAEARRQMDSLLAYRRQLRQEAAEKGLSVAEVTRLDMEATEKANEALNQTRMQGMESKLNGDYEKQFEQVPEDFKKEVRPIWEKYNKQRAALAVEVTDQKTYQARMQQLAEQETQELQAAQQAYISAQQQ